MDHAHTNQTHKHTNTQADMDLDLLVSCANSEGDKLVAGSFGFSSWMGISITPSFVLNEHHKISGFPSNFSAELCLHLQHAAAQQASGEPAQLAGEAVGQDRGGMHEAPQLAQLSVSRGAGEQRWRGWRRSGPGRQGGGYSTLEGVGYWVPMTIGMIALPGLAMMAARRSRLVWGARGERGYLLSADVS